MDSVFLNGTVGVGKSTTADTVGALERGTHAVIDLDQLRRLSPAARSDGFNHELELRNLRAVAANYREAGARRFILAGVIEEPGEVPRYVEALGSDGLLVCRLVADPAAVERRLRLRHVGDPEGLDWHLRRAGELDAVLDISGIAGPVIDTTHATPRAAARAIRAAAGWD